MRRLSDTINGSRRSKDYSESLESGEEGADQPLLCFLDHFRRSAVQINRDVSALADANERVASGAHDQSEAVSRTATSVEALSDRIDRIARNAGEAAEACEIARQEAQQGLEQVHSVIEGMDGLLTRIEANGRKVRRLDERSSEIAVIVELIRGISSRTDMLALNATIESIRAGNTVVALQLSPRRSASWPSGLPWPPARSARSSRPYRPIRTKAFAPERGTGANAPRVATDSRDRHVLGAHQTGRRKIGPAG